MTVLWQWAVWHVTYCLIFLVFCPQVVRGNSIVQFEMVR